MLRKKILLLGDFSVGKTSLVRRYVDGAFDDKYLTTIGVKISKKILTLDEKEFELLLWDVEGSTPSKKISLGYYKGASGAIFVTDVTRSETLESLAEHQKVFLNENPNAKYIVAYNKTDMLTQKQKDTMVLNDDSYLTSAKENENVEILFMKLLEKILV